MTTRIPLNNKVLASILGLGLLFLVACGTQVTPADIGSVPGAIQPGAVVPSSGNAATAQQNAGIRQPVSSAFPVYNGQGTLETGIRVSGQGQASGTPDLAILNVGVEAFSSTVVQARNDAAVAMDDVLAILRGQGIADKDIQTRFFNISPRYTSREITRCIGEGGPDFPGQRDCFPERTRVITGYQVSNQLTVKVRDLDAVGGIIDLVVEASGNLVRFQGISFTIEDTKALEEQARAAAVADLMDKAGQLSGLAGVQLGALVSITETSGPLPLRAGFAESRAFALLADVSTPISPGEQSVTVTVQGIFAIQ